MTQAQQMQTPTTVRNRSDAGSLDAFETPHHLRAAKSTGHFSPINAGMNIPYNGTSPFERVVSTANFVPKQQGTRSSATPSIVAAPSPTFGTQPYSGFTGNTSLSRMLDQQQISSLNKAAAALNVSSPPVAVPDVELSPEAEERIRTAISIVAGSIYGQNQAVTPMQKERLAYQALKIIMHLRTNDWRLGLEGTPEEKEFLQAINYSRTAERQDPNDSEQGGEGCWVSTSSIEKRRISPVGSPPGSDWDGSERMRMQREVDDLVASGWGSEDGTFVAVTSPTLSETMVGGGVQL